MKVKDYIPESFKTQYRYWQRRWYFQWRTDIHWAKKGKLDGPSQLEVKQSIKPGEYLENKLQNLRISATALSAYILQSGECLSFWRCVGKPSARRGFQQSRNLVNGHLQPAYGGGLCQMAGILHQLALLTGLEIVERHNHSVDIYHEEERFAPLGTDAAVVYARKDLVLRNPFDWPVQFDIQVKPDVLCASLFCEKPVLERMLVFEREEAQGIRQVRVLDEMNQCISTSSYKIGCMPNVSLREMDED